MTHTTKKITTKKINNLEVLFLLPYKALNVTSEFRGEPEIACFFCYMSNSELDRGLRRTCVALLGSVYLQVRGAQLPLPLEGGQVFTLFAGRSFWKGTPR